MDFNPIPPKVRFGIYVFNGIGSIMVAYLLAKEYIGEPEFIAWTAYNVFSSGLAAFNVATK